MAEKFKALCYVFHELSSHVCQTEYLVSTHDAMHT